MLVIILNRGVLKEEAFKEIVYTTYVKNAQESLLVAEELFNNKASPLWVVVSSYYAMFYMGCAYIYKKGYKAKHEIVHQVINESLIVVGRRDIEKHFLEEYEEEKDKALSASGNFLNDYEYERAKRSQFQYETTNEIKESKAKTSLERAKNFVAIMRRVVARSL